MALYKNREKFSGVSVKIGVLFAKIGLSPNGWTLITIIPTLLAFWMLTQQQFIEPVKLFLQPVEQFIEP